MYIIFLWCEWGGLWLLFDAALRSLATDRLYKVCCCIELLASGEICFWMIESELLANVYCIRLYWCLLRGCRYPQAFMLTLHHGSCSRIKISLCFLCYIRKDFDHLRLSINLLFVFLGLDLSKQIVIKRDQCQKSAYSVTSILAFSSILLCCQVIFQHLLWFIYFLTNLPWRVNDKLQLLLVSLNKRKFFALHDAPQGQKSGLNCERFISKWLNYAVEYTQSLTVC